MDESNNIKNCSADAEAEARSSAYCGAMNDVLGPFAACLSSIPAQGHMDSCVYDVCSTKGTKTTMKQLSCAAMATMAEECTALRFVINQWRTLSGCGKYYSYTYYISLIPYFSKLA